MSAQLTSLPSGRVTIHGVVALEKLALGRITILPSAATDWALAKPAGTNALPNTKADQRSSARDEIFPVIILLALPRGGAALRVFDFFPLTGARLSDGERNERALGLERRCRRGFGYAI